MRLDRYLVALGEGSRTEVQDRIRRGQVCLQGHVMTRPETECGRNPEITLEGRRLDTRLIRHVMLHKPEHVLTAARDRKQKTVMDLLPGVYASLGCMPVGRLDRDTTGLLLLTCDGELNHRLLSPRRHVDKVYEAEVEGTPGAEEIRRFGEGLFLGDFTAAPALLEILETGEHSLARVTIHEGKFHQVRRMFEAVGHPVRRLHRSAFGPLILPEDPLPGTFRELTETEENAVYAAAGMERKQ